MGYFRRPIDRARSREEARRWMGESFTDIPWAEIPQSPPIKACFVRFSAPALHPASGVRTGLFTATYDLLEDPDTDPIVVQGLRPALDWFNEHLPGPFVDPERSIWFFKSTPTTCMERAWELIHHLREAGVVIEMQSVERPGRIVYEDEFQIAVVPWADAGVR